MEELSTHAYRAYLVYETPGFERYFWESTVIGEIPNLREGDTDDRVVQGVHLTINGVAAGLRNIG
jgi:phosphoenolpyruvate carboxylase